MLGSPVVDIRVMLLTNNYRGAGEFSEEALRNYATQVRGTDVTLEIGGPVIGKVLDAVLTPEGVVATLEVDRELTPFKFSLRKP